MRTRTMRSLLAIIAFAWIASSTPVVGRSTEYMAGGIAFERCDWFSFDAVTYDPVCNLALWTDSFSPLVAVDGGWRDASSTSIQPKWSPDGSRIAFSGPEIYVVNVGDLMVVNVTNHPAMDSAAAWSPDGTRIAFLSDRTGATELYSVNHDGTNLVSLTNAIGFTGQFAWSPTANTLAIVRQVDGAFTLDRINGDGSNRVQLTSGEGFTGGFVWSPSGSAVAITRQVQGVRDLYRMNSDGSNLVRLTAGGEITGGFTWSPDSSRIAFDCGVQVCAINADGTGLVHLASGDHAVFAPAGDRIAFLTDFGQGPEIAVREQNGAIVRVAPGISGVRAQPVWSPDGASILIDRLDPDSYEGWCFAPPFPSNPPPCTPVYAFYLVQADGSGLSGAMRGRNPDWFRPRAGQPVASFNGQCTGSTCVFDASASSDSNGSITTYTWSFGDGTSGSGSTISHTYAVSGLHRVAVTVADNAGLTSTVGETFFTNAPPVASFTSACTGGTCTFDASQSVDPDGSIASYFWNFGDGSVGSNWSITTHSYISGTFTVRLTVRDGHGAEATASTTVQVVNPLPVASFESACNAFICSFDGTGSQDDGTIGFNWNFGDGTHGFGATTNHTYSSAGTYTVVLTVTDAAGQQATATKSVTTVRGVMHVGDLDAYADQGPQGSFVFHVTITVHNANHQPVSNAAVDGLWSSGVPRVCTTNAAGQCDVSLAPVKKGAKMSFRILSLKSVGYDYQATSNHDPDGDSNGTLIDIRDR